MAASLAGPHDANCDTSYGCTANGLIDLKDFAVFAASWDLPSSEESDWYYLHDALGSVIGIVGARFGRESDRQFILYDAYGQPDTLPANSNPYLFTGRRYDRVDDDQILYYLRARHYGPLTGRFLQTDPIGYIDGMNPYEYVRSRPTMKSDPWGLAALHWTPGGVGFPTEYRQIQLSSPASTLRNKILGRTLLRSGRGLLLPLNIYNRFRKNYTIEDERGEMAEYYKDDVRAYYTEIVLREQDRLRQGCCQWIAFTFPPPQPHKMWHAGKEGGFPGLSYMLGTSDKVEARGAFQARLCGKVCSLRNIQVEYTLYDEIDGNTTQELAQKGVQKWSSEWWWEKVGLHDIHDVLLGASYNLQIRWTDRRLHETVLFSDIEKRLEARRRSIEEGTHRYPQ